MSKPPTLNLDDEWVEYPFVQWIINNGKNIAYWALIALMGLFIASRFISSSHQKAERDFFQAEQSAIDLNNPEKLSQAVTTLVEITDRHPELQAKYDGLIAQALLNDQKPSEATPFADKTLLRVEHTTPIDFQDYSKTTLLIADGQYQTALQLAYQLKDRTINPTLYAFNAIRIALLERELGNQAEEKKAWSEVERLAQGTHSIKISQREMERILSHYNTQGVQLQEFIKQ
jgi:hypothetical protein